MVDENEVQEIIESIRESIPEQMRQAEVVTRDREDILADSKTEAERLIAAAQAQALELVQEQGLYKTAEREARRIIEEANQQANETQARADEYAVNSRESLERQLQHTLGTVRNGISSLRSEAVTTEQ